MDFDVDTQKTLKFLIMRSQKPLAVRSYRQLLVYVFVANIISSSDPGGWHLSHEPENVAVPAKCHLLVLHPFAPLLRLRNIRLQGYPTSFGSLEGTNNCHNWLHLNSKCPPLRILCAVGGKCGAIGLLQMHSRQVQHVSEIFQRSGPTK